MTDFESRHRHDELEKRMKRLEDIAPPDPRDAQTSFWKDRAHHFEAAWNEVCGELSDLDAKFQDMEAKLAKAREAAIEEVCAKLEEASKHAANAQYRSVIQTMKTIVWTMGQYPAEPKVECGAKAPSQAHTCGLPQGHPERRHERRYFEDGIASWPVLAPAEPKQNRCSSTWDPGGGMERCQCTLEHSHTMPHAYDMREAFPAPSDEGRREEWKCDSCGERFTGSPWVRCGGCVEAEKVETPPEHHPDCDIGDGSACSCGLEVSTAELEKTRAEVHRVQRSAGETIGHVMDDLAEALDERDAANALLRRVAANTEHAVEHDALVSEIREHLGEVVK